MPALNRPEGKVRLKQNLGKVHGREMSQKDMDTILTRPELTNKIVLRRFKKDIARAKEALEKAGGE